VRQTNACPHACRTHVEERLADIEYCDSANQDAIGKKCPDWRELCAKVCVTTINVARSGRLIKLETRDKYLDTNSACRSSPNGSGRLIFWCRSLSGIWNSKLISLMLLIANSILWTRCSYRNSRSKWVRGKLLLAEPLVCSHADQGQVVAHFVRPVQSSQRRNSPHCNRRDFQL
jgi:hypothetical protein